MADGSMKAIETVSIGDEVISYNEKTSEFETNKVYETFVHETDLLFIISFENDTVLETTWNHPFWVRELGWVEAKDLRPGDLSLLKDNHYLQITSIEQKHLEAKTNVYNFEVENVHSYMVGEDGVVVHNYEIPGGIPLPHEVRTVMSLMDGSLGNSVPNSELTQDTVELANELANSPVSPAFYGLNVGLYCDATMLAGSTYGPLPPGMSGSVAMYANGDVSVTQSPGVGSDSYFFSPYTQVTTYSPVYTQDSDGVISSSGHSTSTTSGMYTQGQIPGTNSTASYFTGTNSSEASFGLNIPVVSTSNGSAGLTTSWSPSNFYNNVSELYNNTTEAISNYWDSWKTDNNRDK